MILLDTHDQNAGDRLQAGGTSASRSPAIAIVHFEDLMTSGPALSDGRTAFPVGPLSVNDLDRLVASLPAQQRATLAWSPRDIREALDTVRHGDVTIEVLARTAERAFELLGSIIGPIAMLLGSGRFSLEVSTLWRRELDTLRAFLPDAAAVHAAEWTFGAFDSVCRLLPSVLDDSEFLTFAAHMKPGGLPSGAFASDVGAIFRGQVLLMAAIAEAENAGDPALAAELTDRAFLEMTTVVDILGRAGVAVDPFGDESPENRARRVLSYVQDVRDNLTSGNVERTVAVGRLNQLR